MYNNKDITVKVPDGSCADCVLARKDTQISDGQAGMRKQGDSPDSECQRRLRECRRHGAIDFHFWDMSV